MIEFVILGVSLLVLMLSSDKAVSYLLKLSKIFGISEMSAGFIILSVSTSLPELLVTINSSLMSEGGLGVGSVLGSNVANITVILGLAVIISRKRKLVFKRRVFDNLTEFLFVSSMIPLFILQTGHISLLLGVVLIGLFIFFAFKTPTKIANVEDITVMYKKDKLIVGLKFTLAIIFVIISSKLLVDSSISIAYLFGLPTSVIGATIIAFGTSLPELTVTIQAFRKNLFNVGLGNILGSCITNLTLILGINSLLNNISINIISFTSLILFSILSSMVTWYFVSTGRRLDKREAAIMVGLYLIFILQELGISIFVL